MYYIAKEVHSQRALIFKGDSFTVQKVVIATVWADGVGLNLRMRQRGFGIHTIMDRSPSNSEPLTSLFMAMKISTQGPDPCLILIFQFVMFSTEDL